MAAKSVRGSFSSRRWPTATQLQRPSRLLRRAGSGVADWSTTWALRRHWGSSRPQRFFLQDHDPVRRIERARAPRRYRGQVLVEVGPGEHDGEVARMARARRSARWTRRFAARAARSSRRTCAPSHSVCTITRKRSRSIAAHRAAVRQLPLFALFVPGVTMQTTGFAADTIRGLYEGERLDHALVDARSRTLAIYGHLDLDALKVERIPIVNLPLWELAHIAWFQEYWCLRGGDDRRPTLFRTPTRMFNSSTVPHATRWSLDLPDAKGVREYLSDTLDATREALARASGRGALLLQARGRARGHARRGAAHDAADARSFPRRACRFARGRSRPRLPVRDLALDGRRVRAGHVGMGISSSTTRVRPDGLPSRRSRSHRIR